MVSLVRRPRREAYAGGFAPLAVLGATIFPALAERTVRRVADLMEIGRMPAAPTAGDVQRPVYDGYGVDGGWRRRYRRSAAATLALCAAAAGGVALLVAGAARRREGRGSSRLKGAG
jgi:hypothetical protein